LYSLLAYHIHALPRVLDSFPTRRSSDLVCAVLRVLHAIDDSALRREVEEAIGMRELRATAIAAELTARGRPISDQAVARHRRGRSEEHTSELQSRENLVCRLLLEKKKHK